MPEFLEDKLKREYGENSTVPFKVMNKIGAMKGNKETAKGREMEAKHEAKMQGHNIHEMRIEVHRGKGGEITGHTVHHNLMPSKQSKGSGAFLEETHESFPFGADGQSSSHGSMLNHIGKHLGLASAEGAAHEGDDDENDDEAV